jgi:FtsP/CotA-like multicopper oxidase with cupredoxin domain
MTAAACTGITTVFCELLASTAAVNSPWFAIGGQPYPAKGLQDTVVLPAMSSVVVRIPFDDFTGKFVFHCHILNHEDNGMMALVDVE